MKTLALIEDGLVLHEWPIADTDVVHMEKTSITRAIHITPRDNVCEIPNCERPRANGMSRRCPKHRYEIVYDNADGDTVQDGD